MKYVNPTSTADRHYMRVIMNVGDREQHWHAIEMKTSSRSAPWWLVPV